MKVVSLLQSIPRELPEELIETLVMGDRFRIERIVSRGHASPMGFWYDQTENEWVLLLSGAARLEFEGEESIRHLQPGDSLLIPAHTRHRVDWTDPEADTVWLAVFFR